MLNTIIIQPPLVQLNTPYPSGAYLLSFFNNLYSQKKINGQVKWFDLSTELFHKIFCKEGLSFIFNKTQKNALNLADQYESQGEDNISFQLRRYISQSEKWCNWINPIIKILCNGNREYTHEFVRSAHVPRGNRMEQYLSTLQRDVSVEDSQILASLALADLADYITTVYDKNFSLIRYAEHLAVSTSTFQKAEAQLNSPILEDFYKPLLNSVLQQIQGNTLFCVSIPFPGTFQSALFTAKEIRSKYKNHAVISFGGGYINTELREIQETKLFNYCDFLSYDKGYGSYLELFNQLEKQNKLPTLSTTENSNNSKTNSKFNIDDNTKQNPFLELLNGSQYYKITYLHNNKIIDRQEQNPEYQKQECAIVQNLVPDFSQIDFTKSPNLTDDTNPMHRIWNDGSWLKIYMAHGCYWHRCAFCDTTLDYVKDFQNTNIKNLYEGIYKQAQQTGIYGIHFVDEACPPISLQQLALSNCTQNPRLTFWGNIRFEKTFSRDLADLLSYGGLTAVSAGIEIATGKGLSSINKGTEIEHIVSACCAFKEAGILIHSYMIFGFWNQSPQDLIDSMETLRQFFEEGLLDSAFWHKFTLTKHSTVYKEWTEGKHPELKIKPQNPSQFAQNDLHFEGEEKSQKYSAPLNTALNQWMHNQNLTKKVETYFPYKMPQPSIPKNYIKNLIQKYEQKRNKTFSTIPNQNQEYVWLGGIPLILKSQNQAQLSWNYQGEQLYADIKKSQSQEIKNLLQNITPQNYKKNNNVFTAQNLISTLGKELFFQLRGNGLCQLI